MAAMSEEEDPWQESVGEITILEEEHLEAMDLSRVPATIDAVQEASAHGLSASRIFEVVRCYHLSRVLRT
jgi:phenylalanyl-tRNA synthetase beta subunit